MSKYKGTIGQKERFKDKRHDVYRERKKWPHPTRCTTCRAVYTDGRWRWGAITTHVDEVTEVTCPACKRIEDNYPAGTITLEGPFFESNRSEVIQLIRNLEQQVMHDRPLERLMRIDEKDHQTEVLTTGVHLARRIGDSLKRAYQGELSIDYGDAENYVRANWSR